MSDYFIKKLEKIDSSFIKEWNKLWEASPNASVFNSPEWIKMSEESQKFNEFEIFACYDEKGELYAVLPLSKIRCFGVKVYAPPSYKGILKTAFLVRNYEEKLFRKFFDQILKGK